MKGEVIGTEETEMKSSGEEMPGQLKQQGEALEALEKTYTIYKSIKSYPATLVYMLAAYSCAAAYPFLQVTVVPVIFGYDSIANTATIALPSFELYFGSYDAALHKLYLRSIWTSLWSSMTNVGQIFGSALAGPLSQRIGRRYSGMMFAVLTMAGVAMQFVSTGKGVLLAGKMVNGVAVGGLMAVGTTYASEIAPPRLRGILLGGLAFFIIAMQAIGLGIVRAFVPSTDPSAFRTAFAIQWLVGGLPLIAFLIVPESPNYLLMKGRTETALRSLTRLYGKNNNVDARLAHLQNGIDQEMKQGQEKATYVDCFRGSDLKRTLTVCLLMFGNGLIGTSFLTQNIYFLALAGLPIIHAFDINVGGFALALIIMPLMWCFGDNIGRRPLYLVGIVGNIVTLGIVGGLGYAGSSKAVIWAVAILLNLLITWQQFTNTLVTWSMSPQISSYKLRQLTQSISVIMQAFTSWLFAFVTPYMYNVDSGDLGAKTGFVFMGSSILLLIMAWFWIPETQGLTTEDIDVLYESRVEPRRFGTAMVISSEERTNSRQ